MSWDLWECIIFERFDWDIYYAIREEFKCHFRKKIERMLHAFMTIRCWAAAAAAINFFAIFNDTIFIGTLSDQMVPLNV